MRNRELDVIFLGCAVYGIPFHEVAALAGVSEKTVWHVRETTRGKPSTVRAFLVMADKLAAEGKLVRQAGEKALKLIPPEFVANMAERWGFVSPDVRRILEEVNGGPA